MPNDPEIKKSVTTALPESASASDDDDWGIGSEPQTNDDIGGSRVPELKNSETTALPESASVSDDEDEWGSDDATNDDHDLDESADEKKIGTRGVVGAGRAVIWIIILSAGTWPPQKLTKVPARRTAALLA